MYLSPRNKPNDEMMEQIVTDGVKMLQSHRVLPPKVEIRQAVSQISSPGSGSGEDNSQIPRTTDVTEQAASKSQTSNNQQDFSQRLTFLESEPNQYFQPVPITGADGSQPPVFDQPCLSPRKPGQMHVDETLSLLPMQMASSRTHDQAQVHLQSVLSGFQYDPSTAMQSYIQPTMPPAGKAPVINIKNCKNTNLNVRHGELSNTPLSNIIDSTRALIEQMDTSIHVSTYAERSALRKVKLHGCLFIKGRIGTGKTRMGVHIIHDIAKETKRVPVVLTSAEDWNLIPKSQPHGEKGKGEKYVVMVDDIFGSHSLVPSTLHEWEKMFEFMWPSVESGQIYLVLTSRSDVCSRCHYRVQKYSIMKNMPTVEIDEGDYRLRLNEKKNMLQKYCGKLHLTREEIEGLCQLKTILGFPQCCVDFAKRRNAKDKKESSFGPAYSFLAADISTLKENDPTGYFVLLLILKNGSLNLKMLDRPSKEFKAEIENFSDICFSQDNAPNCRTIKEKATYFCGIYLEKKGNEIICHEMVYDVIFREFASTHIDLALNVCSAKTLVRFVRTGGYGTSSDECPYVFVQRELYGEFTERIIQLLLEDDGNLVLDHPCFRDDKFVHVLLKKTDMDTRIQIATKNIGKRSVDLEVVNLGQMNELVTKPVNEIVTASSVKTEKQRIFVYNHQISLMILKGLSCLARTLLFKGGIEKFNDDILDEVVPCALYVNDFNIATKLLQIGVSPSLSSIKALCCTQMFDETLMEKVFSEVKWDSTCDKVCMLSLAVQNRNSKAVSLLTGMTERDEDNLKTFGHCLFQLMFQCSNIIPEIQYPDDSSVAEILDILLNTGCHYDHFLLLCLAATHDDPQALKRLLSLPDTGQTKNRFYECLHYSAIYGSLECFEACLQERQRRTPEQAKKNIGDLLTCCARSSKDGHLKVKLSLQNLDQEGLGVNITDDKGNTPLHLAVLRGDAECVNDLISAGADADVENDFGITPVICAAVANSPACSELILNSEQTLNRERSPVHYCFHEPSRSFVLKGFESHYPDLKIARNYESDRAAQNNIKLFLKFNFNVSKIDSEGQSCLFYACHLDSEEILILLCNTQKSKIDTVDKNGRSILHEAAEFGNTAMIKFLLRYIQPDVRDSSGQTVVHSAARSHREAAEKLQCLFEVTAKQRTGFVADNSGRSVLFPAVEAGDEEVMDYLVEKGLDLNKADKKGTTLSQVAEKYNHKHLQSRLAYRRRLSSTE